MDYKVGMKVTITNEFDYDDPMGVNCLMEELKGKIATIRHTGVNRNGKYYRIDIDNGSNYWTETMFTSLALNKGKPEKKIVENIEVKRLIVPNSYHAVPMGSTGESLFLREYVCRWTTTT